MGTFISAAFSRLGRILTPRINCGSQKRISSTSREYTSGPRDCQECARCRRLHKDHGDGCVFNIDSPSALRHVHTTNEKAEKQGEICTHLHSCGLETALKERSDAQCQLVEAQKVLTDTQTKLKASESRAQDLQIDLHEKAGQLSRSQNTTAVSAKEVQRLQGNLKEKDIVVEDMKLERCQLMTKCQKLEAQLATIEQKIAQESLTSGSYADDHANPGMLEVACKEVDKAAEVLANYLHDNSITRTCPLNSEELKYFVCQISPVSPEEFSRAIQVRHAWGHWICLTMFRCFEHVYFDVDDNGRHFVSPLDSQKHALLCFQQFQHMKGTSTSDSYKECHTFREFCGKKYENLLPGWLVELAFQPKLPVDLVFGDVLQFNCDEGLWTRFLEVAKAVWLLHHLAFSFNPPASILRMPRGTPYEKQFHDSVIPDEDSGEMTQVVLLMTRPAFRLRNSIIRSRVFLSKKP